MIHLRPDAAELFAAEKTVDDFFAIEGEIAKQCYNRRTIRFERGGRAMFIKCHDPLGVGSLLKDVAQLRWPAIGVRAEWRAMHRLAELHVPTIEPVGYGIRGICPATQRSFVISKAIEGAVSLEQVARGQTDVQVTADLRRRLIRQIARLVRRMHEGGVNHRDLYLCHFLLRVDTAGAFAPMVYVIDLHRVQCRRRTPRRWIIKDLAALYFSCMDFGLSQREVLRFIRHYAGRPLRRTCRGDLSLWRSVERRARKLHEKHGT